MFQPSFQIPTSEHPSLFLPGPSIREVLLAFLQFQFSLPCEPLYNPSTNVKFIKLVLLIATKSSEHTRCVTARAVSKIFTPILKSSAIII